MILIFQIKIPLEKDALGRAFLAIDSDGGGEIDIGEFEDFLASLSGLSPFELREQDKITFSDFKFLLRHGLRECIGDLVFGIKIGEDHQHRLREQEADQKRKARIAKRAVLQRKATVRKLQLSESKKLSDMERVKYEMARTRRQLEDDFEEEKRTIAVRTQIRGNAMAKRMQQMARDRVREQATERKRELTAKSRKYATKTTVGATNDDGDDEDSSTESGNDLAFSHSGNVRTINPMMRSRAGAAQSGAAARAGSAVSGGLSGGFVNPAFSAMRERKMRGERERQVVAKAMSTYAERRDGEVARGERGIFLSKREQARHDRRLREQVVIELTDMGAKKAIQGLVPMAERDMLDQALMLVNHLDNEEVRYYLFNSLEYMTKYLTNLMLLYLMMIYDTTIFLCRTPRATARLTNLFIHHQVTAAI